MGIQTYKDLTVWQKSMDLVVETYKLTSQLPKSEKFGLASQLQRASVSIPSNIAEGHKRNHLAECVQFLSISYGSGAELETQIELCKRLPHFKKIDYTRIDKLLDEVMKMLNVLISKLSTRHHNLKPKT